MGGGGDGICSEEKENKKRERMRKNVEGKNRIEA